MCISRFFFFIIYFKFFNPSKALGLCFYCCAVWLSLALVSPKKFNGSCKRLAGF